MRLQARQQQPTRETATSSQGQPRGSSSSGADSEDSFMRSFNGPTMKERNSDVAEAIVVAGRTKYKVAGKRATRKKE